MRYTVFVRNMLLRCIVGIRPDERIRKQPLRIGVTLTVDLPEVPNRDEIDATVDYSALEERIVTLVGGSSFKLLETVADRIADACLSDPRILVAEVTVEKPHALAYASSAGVTVRRERSASGMKGH